MRSHHPIAPGRLGKRWPRRGRQRMLVSLPPRSSSSHHFSGPFSFPFYLSFFFKGMCPWHLRIEKKKEEQMRLGFQSLPPQGWARTKGSPGAAAAPQRPRGVRPVPCQLLTPVPRSSLVGASFLQLETISKSPASLVCTERCRVNKEKLHCSSPSGT